MDSRFIALLLGSLSLAAAQVVPPYRPIAPVVPGGPFVPIVAQNFDLNPDGSYTFSYESGDGSVRDESAVVRGIGPEGPILAVQGSYSYNSPDGPVTVTYIADENGFQPIGSSIHPSIQKAVAFQVAEAQSNPLAPVAPAYRGAPVAPVLPAAPVVPIAPVRRI